MTMLSSSIPSCDALYMFMQLFSIIALCNAFVILLVLHMEYNVIFLLV